MEKNKLYVGNLSYDVNDQSLSDMFKEFGEVTEAVIIMDRMSNRSKGFGFVTFANDADAEKAISALDGKEMGGKNIKVNVAKPREER